MDTAALVALIMSGLLTVAGGLGGLWAKNLCDQHKVLALRCERLEQELAAHREKTAETFLRREDCHRQSDAVLDRLKGIEDKLDRALERMGSKA